MTVMLPTPDGSMEIYEAYPEGEPKGAIIVIQEAFGVNDHIQDVTRRVAAAGYVGVAPAMFHRAGGGTAPVRRLHPGDAALRRHQRRRHPRRRRRHRRAPRGPGLRSVADRHRRVLLRRSRDVPHRGAPQARRRGHVLRRRHREREPARPVLADRRGGRPARRRGSACSATSTRGSPSTTSRCCGARWATPTWWPTSSATPTPTTASTATPARRTTRTRRGTPGSVRSGGLPRISPERPLCARKPLPGFGPGASHALPAVGQNRQ